MSLYKHNEGKPWGRRRKKAICLLLLVGMLLLLLGAFTGCASAEEIAAARAAGDGNSTNIQVPDITGEEEGTEVVPGQLPDTEEIADDTPEDVFDLLGDMLGSETQTVQLVGLLTILSLAPSILIMFTGFVRIVMILSFTRNAMSLQQMPPNQVVIGLALFLSFFVMSPVLEEIRTEAYVPYVAEQITLEEAMDIGEVSLKEFMLKYTYTTDLNMFVSFSGEEAITTQEEAMEVPMSTLVPAFLTSELKTAFQIGFFIFIPFIVIDMIVASTLMAMGMMMLPPVIISLPFKVLLFVVADGWALTMQTILAGFS